MSEITDLKKALGTHAADRFVQDGMKLGLGTGSTAIWAARRVAARLSEGSLHDIRAVVTSLQTELEARSLGIRVYTLNDASLDSTLDLVIDGADEVDPSGHMIKGGGGALLMEKIIAYCAQSLVIIVDDSKLSQRLCERFAIPVEVVADAVAPVSGRLREMGGEVSLRMAMRKAGPVVTDLGTWQCVRPTPALQEKAKELWLRWVAQAKDVRDHKPEGPKNIFQNPNPGG